MANRTHDILRTILNRGPIAGIPGTEGEPGQRPLPASQRSTGGAHSSAIAGLGYNADVGRLMVTFTTGRTYAYYGVSPDTYRAFRNADSKGRFFNANIRNYPYERMG